MKRPRLVVATAIASGAMLLSAPARAHIDPDPVEAQAGSEQSVGFTVEHGCDGSPTVQLDMRLPAGTAAATPEPPEGWTASVDADVVTFRGGPLADDVELTFRVRMVLPPTPDTDVYFPFVQRCEVGEIRWIDVPTDGSGTELDEPAPAMRLTGPVAPPPAPTATSAVPATTTPATPAASVPATTSLATAPAPTTTAAPAPSTTEPLVPATSTTAVVEASDGGDTTGTVAVVAGAAAVALVGGLAVTRMRSRRA